MSSRCKLFFAVVAIVVLLRSPEIVQCQVVAGHMNETALINLTQSVYTSISDLTYSILNSDVGNRASFCVKDR